MGGPMPVGAAGTDLPGVAVELASDATLRVCYSTGVSIGDTEAQQVLSRVQELAAGTLPPMLVELTGLGSMTSTAMALFANGLPVSRMALIGMSPVDVAMAKFFNTVHRPPYPVEYFSSRPQALAWLAQEPQNALPGDPFWPRVVPAGGGSARSTPDHGRPNHRTAAVPGTGRESGPSPRRPGAPEKPARRRAWKKLAEMFAPAAGPDTAGGRPAGTGPAIPDPGQPAQPVGADTLRQVTDAYHGKIKSRSFPKATAVAAALDHDHLRSFTALLGQCPPAERDLIATHLYRHYLHSPRQLAQWVKTAGHNYFHARAKVAGTGIGRAPARPGKISTARRTDRDSAGFNVAQEARDAIALVNGLVRSHWPGHIGLEAQHNLISLAASLARLLITAGDDHPLAGSYREYTDLSDVRHSILENGTGLIDLVLKHPEATGLLCEYIDSGRYNGPEGLRRAVLNSSLVLRGQRPATTAVPGGRNARPR